MGVLYRFNLGANPCNICTNMQGTHPTPPQVPVHPNCDCTVERISEDTGCAHEIRNARSQKAGGSESEELVEGDSPDPLPEDVDITVQVHLGERSASWDDELLKEACGWSPPSGSVSQTITIPAGTQGQFSVKVQLSIEEITCVGELWEACRRAPASGQPGGLGHTVDERILGMVGGGALAVVGVGGFTLETQGGVAPAGGDGDGTPYHDDDDEVPV